MGALDPEEVRETALSIPLMGFLDLRCDIAREFEQRLSIPLMGFLRKNGSIDLIDACGCTFNSINGIHGIRGEGDARPVPGAGRRGGLSIPLMGFS